MTVGDAPGADFLETPRLLLRRFRMEDGPAVHAYMADGEVTRWLPEGLFDAEAAQKFVDAQSGEDSRFFAAVLKGNARLVGHFSFHAWGELKNRTFEIGWVISRDGQGHGLATEGAARLLELGFGPLGLRRIIATCQPENIASRRVAEKLGMRCEGLFRQCIYRGGGVWWDELFFAVLSAEHTARPTATQG